MRSIADVERALALAADGLSDGAIARATGIPRSTIRDWRVRGVSATSRERRQACVHQPEDLPREQYAYLLGIYLGDGHISAHPRGVFKLRVYCDEKYPQIIDAVRHAMELVRGHGKARIGPWGRCRCVEVSMYWKHWPCLFPQHGPGLKSKRNIELADWQLEIVEEEPEAFLCGLIDSDGCRITANYVERNGKRSKYGRYTFSNRSEQIHQLFRNALDAIGVPWTKTQRETVVARQKYVRQLDQFIGFKE